MAQQSENIQCPNCGTTINVSALLSQKLEQDIRRSMQAETEVLVNSQMEERSSQIRQAAKLAVEKEQSERFKLLQTELNEKSLRVKELYKAEAEVLHLRREKEELGDKIKAETEKNLHETVKREKEKIRHELESKSELQVRERNELIQQLKQQLGAAQRKVEQGSIQQQGEVQELAIEQWLRENYPLDAVDEIGKGVRGADCLQTVNTRTQRNCGTIYYESKRTKTFQQAWIEKFKQDAREKRADIAVLVTETMPADMSRMGNREGIWLCNYDEFKGLSAVLRETLIRVHAVQISQANRGSKMELLYDFLTGNEFQQQLEAIVEGFSQLKVNIEAEKRSMHVQWNKREKQIEKVLLSTTQMYGSIKGIAGNAVPIIGLLELPSEPPAEQE